MIEYRWKYYGSAWRKEWCRLSLFEFFEICMRKPEQELGSWAEVDDFAIDIGHQGSALILFFFFFFTSVMDGLTKGIQQKVPWCMLFVDNIVFIDETRTRG